jgi:hypothetical protein
MAIVLISEPLPPQQIVGRSLPFWALALDVSTRHLYRQIERGRLRVFKIGDRTIATPEDIRKMLHAGAIDAEASKPADVAPPQDQIAADVGEPARDAAEPAEVQKGASVSESATNVVDATKEGAEAGAEVQNATAK